MLENILTKKKIEYIWHYYKFHILLVGFLIYAIFSMLNYWVFNTPKEVLARVVLYEKGIDVKKAKQLEEYLNKSLNDNMKKKKIRVESWDLDSPKGLNQKMQLMVASQKIDILISGIKVMNSLDEYGIFDENKVRMEISENKEFSEKIFYYKKPYVSILKNTKKAEIAKQIVNLLEK